MQPLQIQGYSGQGIKRKTPTGDGNKNSSCRVFFGLRIKTKSPTGDENTYSIAILLVIFLNK